MPEQGMNDIDMLDDLQTTDIKGKSHPTADGLVSRAHRDSTDRGFYLVGTAMRVLMAPTPENNMTAIVHCQTKWGSVTPGPNGETEYTFEEIGDANADNCNAQIAPHFIRMAATRAQSRCISVALNISQAAAEELLEGGGHSGGQTQQRSNSSSSQGGGAANGSAKDDLGGWNGNLWYGSDKGKHYTDPSISVKTLQWGADKTNNDKQKQALLNEIARREGGGSAPSGNSGGGSDANWKPTPALIGELVKLGQPAGMNFPAIKQMAADNFEGKNDIAKLNKDEFNMLRVMLGGDPID